MLSTRQPRKTEPTERSRTSFMQATPRHSAAFKLAMSCLAVTLVTAPVSNALAQESYMAMQFEFELTKKPRFRQLNLAYRDDFGETPSFFLGEPLRPSVVVPLYSMDADSPALFNRLDDAKQEEEEPKMDLKAVLATLVGVGIIAAYAYVAGKCIQDISNYDPYASSSGSGACEAL